MRALTKLLGFILHIVPGRTKRINFGNPWNGRRWLDLLESHPKYGLLFHKSLVKEKADLGFSFRTNEFGLRGPCNPEAPNVILGTSFAMGLSVNNGENWYDLACAEENWFNGAMPVAPMNNRALLRDLYQGSAETLLYIYHPNIWVTSKAFLKAHREKRTIFDVQRWRTKWSGAAALYLKWLLKEFYKVITGKTMFLAWQGKLTMFNLRYSMISQEQDIHTFESAMAHLNQIFAQFQRVIVVRVPVKEQYLCDLGHNDFAQQLLENYNENWNFFTANAGSNVEFIRCIKDEFSAADYHAYDTHWTSLGNSRFASVLSEHDPDLFQPR